MKYRKLGRTGLEVSEIGCGGWAIGGGWGPKDDALAIDALNLARDLGVNFFDTAYGYGDGHSEMLIGKAFAGRREDVIIASKVPTKTMRWPTLETEPVSETFPAEHIIRCTERTLQKLGTDYLDVQQLHAWSDAYNEQLEWYDAMVRLREQGKIRFFGVSANDWEPYNTTRLVESGRVDTVQVIYNLFEQRPAERLLPTALEYNVGMIVRVPFEEGLLTGRFRTGHAFAEGDWRAEWMTPQRLAEAEPHIAEAEAEIEASDPDLPGLALRFVLAHPAVSTVIPGMRKLEHVRANTAVGDLPALDPQRASRLEQLKWYHGWPYPWDQRLV